MPEKIGYTSLAQYKTSKQRKLNGRNGGGAMGALHGITSGMLSPQGITPKKPGTKTVLKVIRPAKTLGALNSNVVTLHNSPRESSNL